MRRVQTHVQSDGDDVQRHRGICNTAEGGGLEQEMTTLHYRH